MSKSSERHGVRGEGGAVLTRTMLDVLEVLCRPGWFVYNPAWKRSYWCVEASESRLPNPLTAIKVRRATIMALVRRKLLDMKWSVEPRGWVFQVVDAGRAAHEAQRGQQQASGEEGR